MSHRPLANRPVLWALCLGGAALLAGATSAPGPRAAAPPDPDEVAERRHLARTAIRENCFICHGEEMISSQRLTPKQWAAEIEKMVGWGSPIPVEARPGVIDYLAAEYPATTTPPPPATMTIAAAVASIAPEADTHAGPEPSADRGAALHAKHCANCHGPDGQGAELGSNLVEKPVLYREVDFRSVLREGLNRMPAFAGTLSPKDEADLLAWLRSRRFRPASGR